ncbi:MAG: type secretion system protein VirD4 [Sphingomonadales bacterium]|jgi:type IV secretion system protein VirD4|nr:type secretion system protein VirD4 [Sphingomonadales bacterium]
MWDGLRKFAGSVAGDLLTEDQKARAASLARKAHEAAASAASAAAEKGREWQEARRQAELARRESEAAEEGRQRALGEEHGFKSALTFELKEMLDLPVDARERARGKTAVEDKPPGPWFAPFGRDMRVPDWLNAAHPFFGVEQPFLVRKTFLLSGGSPGFAIWQPRPLFNLNAVTWFYEGLIVQCLFERFKRGLPVLGTDNRLSLPPISAEGYPLVDIEEREDGSVWGLEARPGTFLADIQEQDGFTKLLGRYVFTPFKGQVNRKEVVPRSSVLIKEPNLIGYSVCRPEVRWIEIEAADPERNPYAPRSIVHGSAQWAWRDRLAAGGMIDAGEPEAITGHTFLGRSVYRFPNGEAVMNHLTCWNGEGHRLIVGPPGSGKFTTAIAPLLLWSADADSAFVLDVKNGEATEKTSEHRASLGPVTVLDPFGITARPSGAINPIDLLREDNKQLVATAERIADAIFVPSNSSDQHWDQAAKKTLAALLMHIGTAACYAEEERNLRTLRNIVREQLPDAVLEEMYANEAGDGEIAAEAKAMLAAKESGSDKYLFSVIASLNVNIGFLKVPEILAATERTSFDPRELRQRVSTLYVVVPDHQLAAVSRWVRLIYSYVMEQLREAKGGTHVHVVLDEFPALGKFERVAQDMAQTRSLGVHMHVVVQTFQQLLDTYGKGWERFQGTSAVTHILGVRDNFTGEQVSKMLGTTTVKTSGESQTRGNSGGSQSQSSNYAARPLMTADELMAMPAERCVAVVGGMNPVKLEKVAYFS